MKKKNQMGFTLLEVVIALAVLLIGLLGLLILVNFTIRSAQVSFDRLIAANLAQEALEVIRSDRDTSGPDWDNWYNTTEPGVYRLAIKPTSLKWELIPDPTPHEEKLRFDSYTGLYFYQPSFRRGQLTSFSRGVTIGNVEYSGQTIGKAINVEVKWQTGKQEHVFEIESILYNWPS